MITEHRNRGDESARGVKLGQHAESPEVQNWINEEVSLVRPRSSSRRTPKPVRLGSD